MADSLLLEAFNIYYRKGIEALKKGDLPFAKRNFIMAAESIMKLSKESTEPLRTQRIERSKELMNFVAAIDAKMAGANTPMDGATLTMPRSNATYPLPKSHPAPKPQNRDADLSAFSPAERPTLRLDDVAGLETVKATVRRTILGPREHPELYRNFNKKRGGGILLYGVPGTGKTMIAKAIAGEIDAAFYSVKCSDIASKWFGDSEKNISNLFDEARSHEVSIIFFDEFEALGATRDSDSSVMKRVVPELLAQMQGFEENENTLVLIAATNRPWDIDSAFLRPGRFSNPIYVPLPDDAARLAIIEHAFKGIKIDASVDMEELVASTAGFSGADISDNLCERIKDFAIERCLSQGTTDAIIVDSDVQSALAEVHSSVKKEDLEKVALYEQSHLS